MGTFVRLRQRRSAAQLYAVAQVEREIRAADPHSRRKYLREFTQAFQSYRDVLSPAAMQEKLLRSDVLLVGDYHALPACQLYTATLIGQLAATQPRPLVLALEAVFAHHQPVLEAWQNRRIGDRELREKIRFDLQWGFDWEPFLRLLLAARAAKVHIRGLDCMPRADLRRIAVRDEHAAERIASIAAETAGVRIIVLFGESHLAPQHLPAALQRALPHARILTLLQNIDPLYWQAQGEPGARVQAVRVSERVLCVFNATPLEKYESYRQCLEAWRQEKRRGVDLTPPFYNLISALLQFLGIGRYGSGAAPYLRQILPEVSIRATPRQFAHSRRKIADNRDLRELRRTIERDGCAYSPLENTIYAMRFELPSAAAAAARFVHFACSGRRGLLSSPAEFETPYGDGHTAEDRFYGLCLDEAMAEFGARILYSARKSITEQELYSSYVHPRRKLEGRCFLSYPDHLRLIDFVVLHKDFECNARLYRRIPELITEGRAYTGDKLRFVTALLGQLLGGQLYQAYLQGCLNRRFLRSLFFRRFDHPGESKLAYFQLARRTRATRRNLAA